MQKVQHREPWSPPRTPPTRHKTWRRKLNFQSPGHIGVQVWLEWSPSCRLWIWHQPWARYWTWQHSVLVRRPLWLASWGPRCRTGPAVWRMDWAAAIRVHSPVASPATSRAVTPDAAATDWALHCWLFLLKSEIRLYVNFFKQLKPNNSFRSFALEKDGACKAAYGLNQNQYGQMILCCDFLLLFLCGCMIQDN